MLNPRGDRPLYHQLADLLRDQIRDGVYPAGLSLPSEVEITERYEVNRPTVRKAMAILREEGLITTRRGERSAVRPQVERRLAVLGAEDRLTCRIPSQPERVALNLESGIALLEIRRSTGAVELLPSDQVEIVGPALVR
jgi:DNA-binding FadR family transcriptional regulator